MIPLGSTKSCAIHCGSATFVANFLLRRLTIIKARVIKYIVVID